MLCVPPSGLKHDVFKDKRLYDVKEAKKVKKANVFLCRMYGIGLRASKGDVSIARACSAIGRLTWDKAWGK